MVKMQEKAAWLTLHSVKLPQDAFSELEINTPILSIETQFEEQCQEIEVPVVRSHQKGFADIDHELCVVFDEVAMQYPNTKKLRVAITFVVKLKPGNLEVGTLQLKMDAVKLLGLDQGQQELQLGNSDARLCLTLRIVEVDDVPITIETLGGKKLLQSNGSLSRRIARQLASSRASSSVINEEMNGFSAFEMHGTQHVNQKGALSLLSKEWMNNVQEVDDESDDSVVIVQNHQHLQRPVSAEPEYGHDIREWLKGEETHRRSVSHMVRYEAPDFNDTFMDCKQQDFKLPELQESAFQLDQLFQDKATQTDHELLKHYIFQLVQQGQLQTETLNGISGEQKVVPVFFVVGDQQNLQSVNSDLRLDPFGSLLQTPSMELKLREALGNFGEHDMDIIEEQYDQSKDEIDVDLDDIFANLLEQSSRFGTRPYRAMSDIGDDRPRHDPEEFFQQGSSAPSTVPFDFPFTRRKMQEYEDEYENDNHSQQDDGRSYNYTPEVEDIMWYRKNLRRVQQQSHNMYSTMHDNDDDEDEGEHEVDESRSFTPVSDFYPERVTSALSNSIMPSYSEAPPILQTIKKHKIKMDHHHHHLAEESRPESRISDNEGSGRLSNAEMMRCRLTPINTTQDELFREMASTPSLRRVVPKTPRTKKDKESLPEWVALAKAKQIKIQSFSKASHDIEQAMSNVRRSQTPHGSVCAPTPTNLSEDDNAAPTPFALRRTPLRSVTMMKGDKSVGLQGGPSWRMHTKLGRSTTMIMNNSNDTPVQEPEWQRLLRERRKKYIELHSTQSNNSESSQVSIGRQESAKSVESNGKLLPENVTGAHTPLSDWRKSLKRVDVSNKGRQKKSAPHLSGKVKDLKRFFDFSNNKQEEGEDEVVQENDVQTML